MDSKAQTSLETILVAAVLLLITAWAISSLTQTSSKAKAKLSSNAKKAIKALK